MSYSPPSASNPSLATSAYMVSSVDRYTSGSDDEIASLPSESTTASDLDTLSDDYSDAEEEWRESIEQLELLLTMVIVPFIGKYLGRRCAYWGWTRFMEWKYPVEVVMTNKAAFRGAEFDLRLRSCHGPRRTVVIPAVLGELREEQQQLPSLEVVASFRDCGSLVTFKTRKLYLAA
ncbi:uncharacterized protein tam7 [Aspergillus lentulus]|uniref:Uncharacterized protein tam7 n=1 Tax=Aspergillus lentulus TaxID=293939 RepID=A0AAN4PDZ6_ASPLE|nr:hypothetical protein CNMCM6069_002150 [Aspergillus lentulus]KAF4161186.1 hypothetical protein CNMCM6936_003606 [Aspergillus lentulus]KAF4171175.1 hypothetical protein CNMCM8060_003550 [Aspergillus lentulus]KAF4177704.1 hypothetical protein CNMCM7927_002965 [Aspergillus lentulus]KAF4196347.1 hypothetical protein CNMCM8694_005259 [Aspergillus lentulus]